MIDKTSVRRAALAAAALAAVAVSCGTTPEPDRQAAGPGTAATTAAPVKVRDAFATLQATLYDSCANDCAYFLGRVHSELRKLDGAMKADPKGPGHFPEPIQKIAELNETLGGDSSPGNLKKHEKLIVGTRDFINTWMQGHPDDYR
ncbi:hypothetical protein ACWFR1_08025 [Streptomyces sp. NPDC055103]